MNNAFPFFFSGFHIYIFSTYTFFTYLMLELIFWFNVNVNARLNSHYEASSYKKKQQKKITAYRKSV